MESEKLIFLDTEVYLQNGKIRFRKYRKNGEKTVISNYKHNVSAKKYLLGNILTQLHRQKDCCSDDQLFSESLEEMREIYSRNGYPSALVEEKIKFFQENREKPDREPANHTVTLDYTAPAIEKHMNKLTAKMKQLLPSFRVNVAYKSIKVTQLFSKRSKAKTDMYETPHVVYKMQCTGPKCSSYIGQTEKPLIKRIEQHQQYCHARGVYFHMENCEVYNKKFDQFCRDNGDPMENTRKYQQLRIEFLKSHFTILEKNLANWKDRRAAEAYYIRAQRPLLNGQKDHATFRLF